MSSTSLPIDTSEREPAYLWRCANGRYLKLSASAHYLLTQADAGRTPAELAGILSQQLGRATRVQEVEGALSQVRAQIAAIEERHQRPRTPGLWIRVRCLPSPAIEWLSRRLSILFHPVAAFPLIAVALFGFVNSFSDMSLRHRAMMDPGPQFFAIFGLFVVSMLAHEFGHAAACARYGASTRDIGLGFYIIFPIAYSDVSAAWALTRRQRVIVDLAGVFFQFLVGFAYAVAYRFTGWEPFLLAAALIFGFGLFVLLPIFKLDGYWLLADLLGVVNLYRQVPRVVAHLRARIRGRASAPLPWPGWVSTAVLVYGVLSALFLVFFGARLVMIFAAVAETYPARMAGLMRDLTQPPYRPANGRMHTVIGPTYVMLGVSFALARLGMAAVRAIKRVKR